MATTYNVKIGTTLDTITKVNALSLVSGDIVSFNQGDTFGDATLVGVSGVTYNAYGSGDRPIISKGMTLTNKQTNITIQDLEFDVSSTASSGRAITLAGCQNITFDNCLFDGKSIFNQVIYGSGHIDLTYLDNLTIQNCEVKNGGAAGAYSVTSISFVQGCRNIIIDSCNIYDFYWLAIQLYTPTAYIATFPSYSITVKNCTVYNTVYDNTGAGTEQVGINIGGGKVGYHSYIENNYVYNIVCGIQFDAGSITHIARNNIVKNCARGIRTMGNAIYGASYGHKIYNNTVIGGTDTTYGIFGIFFYNVSGNASTGNECKNNIIIMTEATAQMIRIQSSGNSAVDCDYNCFYNALGYVFYKDATKTLAQWQALGYDLNSISSDPLLTSAYKLTKDSPCVDAGETLSDVTDDYEGTPRPIGTSSDIGAYEYYSKKICNAEIKNI